MVNVVPRRAFITFALAVLPGAVQAQGCPPLASEPYTGPLFDAMAQMDERINATNALAVAQRLGVDRMALFPRVQPQHNGSPNVSGLAARHPDFIVPGAPKLFEMRGDLDASYVTSVLDGVARRRYAFVGEILYSHADKNGGEQTATGERYIDPLGKQTARLIAGLAGTRTPILTHWEVYDWSRDWPRFDKLYGEFPNQLFVWPHAGFGTSGQLAQVLGAHQNVWATLSKKDTDDPNMADADKSENTGDAILDFCGNVKPDWLAVLERFSDRLMFATDAHKNNRWDHYPDIIKRWRSLLAQLPAALAEAIAHGNAMRLYDV
jgi:hypothetical protein